MTTEMASMYANKQMNADSRFIFIIFTDITYTETGNNHIVVNINTQVSHNITQLYQLSRKISNIWISRNIKCLWNNTVHSTVFSVVGLKCKLKILMSNVFLKNCVLTITIRMRIVLSLLFDLEHSWNRRSKRLEGSTAKSKSIPCRPIQTHETCPAFSCPSISCPSISCLDISMVRHFHVRHFQRPRLSALTFSASAAAPGT